MAHFDVIVLGVGGIGSAAVYQLSLRGLRVLGIEQFQIAHDQGSSHGDTRIIRKAYFEHPSYVPLLHRTYSMWGELESIAKRKLMHRVGLLMIGRPKGLLIPGVLRAKNEHQLQIDRLSEKEVCDRFPGFRTHTGLEALFEADAGYLEAENCIHTHVEQAVALGATVITGQQVRKWAATARSVTVTTDAERYEAGALVVCGGAWSAPLLADLRLPLEIRRKVVFWYRTNDDSHEISAGCPVFAYDISDGFFYGFPSLDGISLKVAEHTGGGTVTDPTLVDRESKPEDEAPVSSFVRRYLPGVTTDRTRHSVCMYTMTPDEHFIIDRHPEHNNVAFAAGFSGHGFKFAPIVGSILADVVQNGSTIEPAGFLSLSRNVLCKKT